MIAAPEPTATLETALAHAVRLLDSEPALAAEQASEILRVLPGHPTALLVLGASRTARGDAAGALEILEPLAAAQPGSAGPNSNSASRWVAPAAATRRSRRCAARSRSSPTCRAPGSRSATTSPRPATAPPPRPPTPAHPLFDPRPGPAARRRGAVREPHPGGRSAAARAPAEVARPTSPRSACWPKSPRAWAATSDAEHLLARCLELAPSFHAARQNYALVLHRGNKPAAGAGRDRDAAARATRTTPATAT